MKSIFFIAILTTIFSCNNTGNKQLPAKSDRTSITKDIVGIWELLKANNNPTEETTLVPPTAKEYLEVKANGTWQENDNGGVWYLSYTDEFVVDSTSKVFFNELTNIEPDSRGDYQRKNTAFHVKLGEENKVKYLSLTSLISSATKVYIRKN